MDRRLLGIYLNDHLAGSVAGSELARRSLSNNRDTEVGAFLERFLAEVSEEQAALEAVMDSLQVQRDRLKIAAAWAAEKAGRLKLNGRLVGYSPLSRLIELEGLSLGVEGKRRLWLVLSRLSLPAGAPSIEPLIERAEKQLVELESLRESAFDAAVGAKPGSS